VPVAVFRLAPFTFIACAFTFTAFGGTSLAVASATGLLAFRVIVVIVIVACREFKFIGQRARHQRRDQVGQTGGLRLERKAGRQIGRRLVCPAWQGAGHRYDARQCE
jgi:hypothetical protein